MGLVLNSFKQLFCPSTSLTEVLIGLTQTEIIVRSSHPVNLNP